VIFGEIGLSGEIRHVAQIQTRLKEANKLGFKHAMIPVNDKIKEKGLTQVKHLRDILPLFTEEK